MIQVEPLFPLKKEHTVWWDRVMLAKKHHRLSQALLLIGPRHVEVASFANRLAASLLCKGSEAPSCPCDSCHLLRVGTHPDFLLIQPDSKGGVIKVDQIRSLQEDVYQSPKRSNCRVIVLEPADKLNVSAANALLKILEEPPSFVYFILVAEQLGTLPPTILSRCQQMLFSDHLVDASNYFLLGSHYPAESGRGQLYANRLSMITGLCDIAEGKSSVCTVAALLAGHDLVDVVWMLYLINAEAIQMKLLGLKPHLPEAEGLSRFLQSVHLIDLFNQLAKINLIVKKLSLNLSSNSTLVLEDILIGYVKRT